jgi:hypothetical protein
LGFFSLADSIQPFFDHVVEGVFYRCRDVYHPFNGDGGQGAHGDHWKSPDEARRKKISPPEVGLLEHSGEEKW